MMTLYATPNSPYARMPRIIVLEKGLEDRVCIVPAKTRTSNSPYYTINPSGRVPYLVNDDGVGLEDAMLICAYLDHVDDAPVFDPPAGDTDWQARRLEGLAHSLLSGLAVWTRERYRPINEQSPTVVAHEAERCKRMTAVWESEIDDPIMNGTFTMAQIILICALQLEHTNHELDWRTNRPKLALWADNIAQRSSVKATLAKLPSSGSA